MNAPPAQPPGMVPVSAAHARAIREAKPLEQGVGTFFSGCSENDVCALGAPQAWGLELGEGRVVLRLNFGPDRTLDLAWMPAHARELASLLGHASIALLSGAKIKRALTRPIKRGERLEPGASFPVIAFLAEQQRRGFVIYAREEGGNTVLVFELSGRLCFEVGRALAEQNRSLPRLAGLDRSQLLSPQQRAALEAPQRAEQAPASGA